MIVAKDGQGHGHDDETDGTDEDDMHTLLLTLGYDLYDDRLCTQCTIPVILRDVINECLRE